MKLKLSQLSRNVVILIENCSQGLKVYYADGHYEITIQKIQDCEHVRSQQHKYKNPIIYETYLLFPTQNQKDYECKWINLNHLEKRNPLYIDLLKEKGLDKKSIKMYLQYRDELMT